MYYFFFSSRRRHTRLQGDWSSDVCSSDLMTKVLYGERISRQGKLRLGCSAAIFDEAGRIFLTRRADNGQWCLPGGGMERSEERRVGKECRGRSWGKAAQERICGRGQRGEN